MALRVIRFRGKEINTGEWVFGFYTQGSWIDPNTGKEKVRHIIHADFLHDVVPETVGQYTGLKDKNGKEIYEGDIVRKRDLTFGLKYEGVVVYNSEIGAFRIHSDNNGITMRMGFEASDIYNDGQCTLVVKYDYEVIGNIFDPELIPKR